MKSSFKNNDRNRKVWNSKASLTIPNLMLFLLACLIAFSMGELLARLFLPAPQSIAVKVRQNNDNQSSSDTPNRTTTTIESYPWRGLYIKTKTGYRLHPNTQATIENHYLNQRQVEVKTNSLGLRNREIGEKIGTRLLFLGDSITMGDYILEQETFTRLVETIATKNGEDWETINAGVGGISLHDELSVLIETGLSLEPDVVILNFYLNDWAESPAIYITRLPSPLDKSWFIHHTARMGYFALYQIPRADIYIKLFRKANKTGWKSTFQNTHHVADGDHRTDEASFNKIILSSFSDWGAAWSPEAWRYMQPTFAKLKSLSLEHDFNLYVVVYPVHYQVEAEYIYDYPQQQLKHDMEQFDIPVLDMLPILRETYHDSMVIEDLFYDHCHHTPYGNEIIAQAIVNFLYEQAGD